MSSQVVSNDASDVDYDPFAGAQIAQTAPTTEPQREVWLGDRLGREASLAYNEGCALRLRGALDTPALETALQDVVARHETLRATFSGNGEQILIAADAPIDMHHHDLSVLAASERERAIAEAQVRAVEVPFDLEKGPLFRAELLKVDANDHVLILAAHHIVCDGWSYAVVIRDLAKLYAKRASRAPGEALAPAPSFAEYATSRAKASGDEADRAAERHWLSRFTGSVPVLDLPTDRPRQAWRTFASKREDHLLDAALVADVRKAGGKHGASLFATLLAGFAATIGRIASSDDVVIGIPAAGQSQEGWNGLVGHCVNLLPVRLAVDPDAPAAKLLAATRSAMLDAFEHQSYTYGTLLKKLAIARDPSRLPLASVMFNLDQALDPNALGFTGLDVELDTVPRSFENFELFVSAMQVKEGLRLECQYNSDLFDAATVRRWMRSYEALLRALSKSVETAVGRLDFATREDLDTLARWNANEREFDRKALAHERFEAQARRAPERCALEFEGTPLAYGELDAQSTRIARMLREQGVGRGKLVGLRMQRSPAMVAAQLGVLKSGAGYVPLDPAYPAERLDFMAQDAGLAVVLGDDVLVQSASRSSEPLARDAQSATPEDRAYVIYTSGSTGKPKGVQVPHRAVVNFLQSMAREPGLSASDRLVAVTTLSFDIAVNELLLPLSVGARVVLASAQETADGALLRSRLEVSGANVMQATPATWRMLFEAGWQGPQGFRAWCGGEALAPDLARTLLQHVAELWNLYGPTETTVWSTACRIDDPARVSIGRPIANTTVWVLDAFQQRCPIGVPGEIWIGGDGVTLGYLKRPELDAERFLRDPFSKAPDARFYRTGDRGRWRGDGTLEHMGRLDFQVKVRGYRIELGEIEACLAEHATVKETVAIAREDRAGDVRLVAYVVSNGAAAEEDVLKAHLRTRVPEYMVPQHIVQLAAIPRLPNGKVDRKALPAPVARASAHEHLAPRNDLERAVAKEMEASLGMPDVGVHDDFFALGGHSLLAAQLTARLSRAFNCRLTMRDLFAAPTIEKLARLVEAATKAPVEQLAIERLEDRNVAPLSIMQERLWFLEELYPGRVTYHAPSAHRLRGPMDEGNFERAFREMVRRQASMRTCFERRGTSVVQRIHDDVNVTLFPAEDLSAMPAAEREPYLMARLAALTEEHFDLEKAPLFKTRLFKLSPDEHVLFFMPHHIVFDGWSFDLLYDEMSALYSAFCAGKPNPLTELPVSYGDFAAWHAQWMQTPEYAAQLSYWLKRLERAGSLEQLPTDKPRHAAMSGEGSTDWMSIDVARTQRLHEIARSMGTTVFVVTLAVYTALLHGYAGHRRFAIGTPVRGRNALELEPIMGYFTNLVLLHLEVDPAGSFTKLVEHVKVVVGESFQNADVPLDAMAREHSIVKSAAGSTLYQALFSFQDGRQRIRRWGELEHEMVLLFQRGATEDLGMWFLESPKGLRGGVTYDTGLFTSETARALKEGYAALLDVALAGPEGSVERIVAEAGIKRGKATAAVAPKPRSAPAAPGTESEKLLAGIWREKLKLEGVGVGDNFFDLGGHSLLAMQAILAMEERTGKRVDRSRYIFETLGQIARAYDEAPAAQPAAKPGALRGLFSGILGKRKG